MAKLKHGPRTVYSNVVNKRTPVHIKYNVSV